MRNIRIPQVFTLIHENGLSDICPAYKRTKAATF